MLILIGLIILTLILAVVFADDIAKIFNSFSKKTEKIKKLLEKTKKTKIKDTFYGYEKKLAAKQETKIISERNPMDVEHEKNRLEREKEIERMLREKLLNEYNDKRGLCFPHGTVKYDNRKDKIYDSPSDYVEDNFEEYKKRYLDTEKGKFIFYD